MKSGSESATNTRYELLPQNEQNELVCDVVLNIDTGGKYTADDNEFRKGTEALPDVERDVPGYSGWKLICKNDSYDVPADVDKGIILCAENVTLSSDFEGLIISGGTVKMVGSGTYKANVSVVGEILEMIRKNEELSKYFRCLDHKDKNSVNVADCISYENWERNSN